MSSASVRASQALSPFVVALHYHECDAAPALERILPGGHVHLLVNLHEDEFRTYHGADSRTVRRSHGAVLEGAASHARVIDTRAMRSLVSVDFTLGGAAAFFRAPLNEARDELVELSSHASGARAWKSVLHRDPGSRCRPFGCVLRFRIRLEIADARRWSNRVR